MKAMPEKERAARLKLIEKTMKAFHKIGRGEAGPMALCHPREARRSHGLCNACLLLNERLVLGKKYYVPAKKK